MLKRFRFIPALILVMSLGACGGPIVKEASYPTKQQGTDKILYSDQKPDTIWGESQTLGSRLFGNEDDGAGGSGGIGVNSFLWRASLDTVSFLPVASADPFGGVILTDWYENPDSPGERYKINIYIMDRQLRADALRISVFKQKLEKGVWHDMKISSDMSASIENSILSRARELRVAQITPKK